jgi:hypothetical protein
MRCICISFVQSYQEHLHVLQQVAQTRPHLLSTRQNLRRRQNESIFARIPHLNRHAECRFRNLIRIVHTISADLVDGVANRATRENRAMDSLDSSNGAVGQGLALRGVGDSARACVAVRVHPELRVRVDVHVELDTLSSTNGVEVGFNGFGLDAVAGGGTFVVFGAGRSAGATGLGPVRWPVAVDVAADAAGRGCGLAVLAPHSVGGLSVGKAVRVDDGEDVEVVLVLEAGSCGIGGGEELVCCILNDPAKSVSLCICIS